MTIEVLPETICKDCGNSFRYNPRSTIKPVRCPKCQNLKDFQTKKENNKKILSQASFYGKISNCSVKKDNNVLKHKLGLKTPKKASVDKRLDEAWAKLVKLRAGNKCEVCCGKENLNSHHIYSRTKHSVRWLPENGVCLCVNHHIGFGFSAHKTPVDFTVWLMQLKGEKFMEDLRIKANTTSNLHPFEKELLLKELLKEIKELKQEKD